MLLHSLNYFPPAVAVDCGSSALATGQSSLSSKQRASLSSTHRAPTGTEGGASGASAVMPAHKGASLLAAGRRPDASRRDPIFIL